MGSKPVLLILAYLQAVSSNSDEPEDKAKKELVLQNGDPFLVTRTDIATGCMFIDEALIPPDFGGPKTFNEPCDPKVPGKRCKLFVRSKIRESKKSNATCLKPTHLSCDPILRKCVCSLEGRSTSQIRFQFGTYAGKNTREGRCFIRPTFEYIHGMDCGAGSRRKEIAVEEEAEQEPMCICDEAKIDLFNTDDKDWWKCAGFTFTPDWILVVLSVAAQSSFSFM